MALETDANPLGTAQASEDRFEGLWNSGAFNPDGRPDPSQGQSAAEPAATSASPDAVEPATAALEPEYRDLDDYLTQAKVDRESFLSLPATVKINGQTKQIPLADLFKSYQQEADYTQKTQTLAQQRQQWDTERTQAQQAIGQHLQQAQVLGNLAHQQLLADYKDIDWNKLRTDDPGRWAVLNQDFQNRAGQIQNHLAQVSQAMQQQELQRQQELSSKTLPAEKQKMLEANPAWANDKQFQADRDEMFSFGRKMGFSDAELSQIYDHRYILALHYASQFLKLQANGTEAAKKVRAAPQMASPGARVERDPKAAQAKQLKERFQKNPRDEQVAAAYFSTLQ